MANGPLANLATYLRRIVAASKDSPSTDRDLLEAFACRNDEAAFAALLRRHGRLVLSVCRRVLGNEADAEDAFQATFLILARKAKSVRWQASIRSWLHQVAYRVSLELRRKQLRRQGKEKQYAEQGHTAAAESTSWHEFRSILDEEINRLPEKYRAPVLLCCLEGKARDEAAQELGWTEATLRGRLFRGRELLRDRLARRGVSLSTGLLAASLLEDSARASVPSLLSVTTLKVAVQGASSGASGIPAPVVVLANSVLRTMLLARLQSAALVLTVIALLASGMGLVARQMLLGNIAPPTEVVQTTPPVEGDNPVVPPDQPINPTDAQPPVFQKAFPSDTDRETVPVRPKGADQEGEGINRCVLKSVDAAGGKITVMLGKQERTFDLAMNAVVNLDQRPGSLADLGAGTLVSLRLGPDRKTVIAITTIGPGRSKEKGKG